MCLVFIQGVTLVVMCVWPLYRVSPWLLYVLCLYTGCHLGCYVCTAFIQCVTLVVMGQTHITNQVTPCIKAKHTKQPRWLPVLRPNTHNNQGDTLYKGHTHITIKVTHCMKAVHT
jgi:hypothetical protein